MGTTVTPGIALPGWRACARFAAAGLLLAAAPAWLLADRGGSAPTLAPLAVLPIMPAPALASGEVLTRPLFGSAPAAFDAIPTDDAGAIEPRTRPRPDLVGIVGRLPDDAVALVRTPDGTSATVAIGGETGGWRLAALAIDAALFVKGGERVRIGLPPAP